MFFGLGARTTPQTKTTGGTIRAEARLNKCYVHPTAVEVLTALKHEKARIVSQNRCSCHAVKSSIPSDDLTYFLLFFFVGGRTGNYLHAMDAFTWPPICNSQSDEAIYGKGSAPFCRGRLPNVCFPLASSIAKNEDHLFCAFPGSFNFFKVDVDLVNLEALHKTWLKRSLNRLRPQFSLFSTDREAVRWRRSSLSKEAQEDTSFCLVCFSQNDVFVTATADVYRQLVLHHYGSLVRSQRFRWCKHIVACLTLASHSTSLASHSTCVSMKS